MAERPNLKFSVLGQDGAIHEVTIGQDPDNSMNLSSHCSCIDAADKTLCGHQFDILDGQTGNVVQANPEGFAVLKRWMAGSDIEAAMIDLSKAKTELRLSMEKVEKCRKKLIKKMID